jgi:hypothetical protein
VGGDGREGSGKLLTILQSDGAVVEEFRVRKAGEHDGL